MRENRFLREHSILHFVQLAFKCCKNNTHYTSMSSRSAKHQRQRAHIVVQTGWQNVAYRPSVPCL